MVPRILFVLLIIVLLDVYVFQAVKTAFQHSSPAVNVWVRRFHWGIAALCWCILLGTLVGAGNYIPRHIGSYLLAFVVAVFLAKLIISSFLLIDDVLRLFRWTISAISKAFYTGASEEVSAATGITRLEFISKAALAIGFIPFATMIKGMVSGKYNYKVRNVQVAIKGLAPEFKGLKIVQVSDIHSGSFFDKEPLQKAVDMINAQGADLVFFTGDLVNNTADEVEPHIETLAGIKAPLGVYSILGNHDYGDYVAWPSKDAKTANLDTLKKHHAACGFRLLLNENVNIERKGQKLALIGVENWGAYGRFSRYGNLEKALEGLATDANARILLSHDPSHWTEVISKQYPAIDLTLSGHTHGFQFGIEIPGFKWSPVQYMYPHWAGLYNNGKDQQLYVNRGLGFLGYPGRVGIMPEITVLELV